MSKLTLVIGNKNYSSWSLGPGYFCNGGERSCANKGAVAKMLV